VPGSDGVEAPATSSMTPRPAPPVKVVLDPLIISDDIPSGLAHGGSFSLAWLR